MGPQPHPLISIVLGGQSSIGNAFPGTPHSWMTTQVDLQPIFGQYILVSLPKHHFIGWFKKCAHKNVKNKIGKIYYSMEDIKSRRSH